jgi:glycosyltransferase involved in cell wall biosynthesis
MPSLAVIVPTYKRPEDLEGILRHLRPQVEGYATRRLIVVNDGTHDDAYASVVRPHLAWMTYVPAPKNRGPGAARNVGARLAKADYLVFTDDDCRPPADWLDRLEARYEADPWLDGVAGYTRPFAPNRKRLADRLIEASRVLPGATHDEVGRLICAVTAAFSVRRSFYEKIDGFDESFRPSGEDLDLTQRLIKAGAIIEADENWWTGHTTSDTLKSYLKRYYTYGKGSARYAYVRRDWLHPDLRNYMEPEDARRTVRNWARSARTAKLAEGAGPFDRLALRWFVARVASCYAAGFMDGCDEYEDPRSPPPTEPWLRWPRLGLAADGLPRR